MKQNHFPKMHVSLYVSDIQQTIHFYSRFFNQEPDKVKQDYAKFILDKPSLVISFVKDPAKVRENFGHLGILVESVEELKEKLAVVQKAGIPHLEEMQTACCYALQDKFWVRDPDGIQWEVYYFHKDVAFNDPAYDRASSKCCDQKEKEEEQAAATSCC